jgi:putative oxidoreductase
MVAAGAQHIAHLCGLAVHAARHAEAVRLSPSGRFDDLQLMSLVGVAGILEVFGGALLVVGLFTRPTAFIMSGLMAAAYFMAHAPRDFFPILNGGTLAALYCFVFFYLVFAGGGAWSLDALWRRQDDRQMILERQ